MTDKWTKAWFKLACYFADGVLTYLHSRIDMPRSAKESIMRDLRSISDLRIHHTENAFED